MNRAERLMIIAALNFYIYFGLSKAGYDETWAAPFIQLQKDIENEIDT